MERTVQAVERFCALARSRGIEAHPRLCHLGRARTRRNRGELLALLRERCGLAVDVLSGEEEADLAYLGAADGARALVLDIGGGSTELVFGGGDRAAGREPAGRRPCACGSALARDPRRRAGVPGRALCRAARSLCRGAGRAPARHRRHDHDARRHGSAWTSTARRRSTALCCARRTSAPGSTASGTCRRRRAPSPGWSRAARTSSPHGALILDRALAAFARGQVRASTADNLLGYLRLAQRRETEEGNPG